jgi:hypothetical protein
MSDDPQEGNLDQWREDHGKPLAQGPLQPTLQQSMVWIVGAKRPDEDVRVQEVHASARLSQIGGEIGSLNGFLEVREPRSQTAGCGGDG